MQARSSPSPLAITELKSVQAHYYNNIDKCRTEGFLATPLQAMNLSDSLQDISQSYVVRAPYRTLEFGGLINIRHLVQ